MDIMTDNWYIVFIVVAVCAYIAVAVWRFYKKTTADQIAAVKEWLLIAVTEAEKSLGEKTGKLKLRYCYDLFVSRFPWAAKVIPFSTFSDWVDDALVEMRKMLEQNESVKDYVEGR